MKNRIIIIGGLSAGPSAAAKARRENEHAEITLFEKTAHISYATCGIPYALSGEIKNREKLMVVKPDLLRTRFKVDVKLNEAVTNIDTEKQTVTTEKGTYIYDKLVYAAGGTALIPPIKNLESCDLWSTCKTIEDFDKITRDKVLDNKNSIVIIGAGLIGLEAAENLRKVGKTVHVIEMNENVLPILSETYSKLAEQVLQKEGIQLHLGKTATELQLKNKQQILNDGTIIDAEYLIIGIGVRPNTGLLPTARKTENGALLVNEQMQTSIPNIYAAGDCVAINNLLTKEAQFFPMGTHSNKGGRTIGAQIGGDTNVNFKGAYGTAIVKLFDYSLARTGLVPTKTIRKNYPYKTSLVVVGSTPGFYPNPTDIYLSIYYDANTKIIVGAEAFGKKGVDKRIDVLSTAIYAKLTLTDLQNIDFAYAPSFSPAKDPILVASYVAENESKDDFSFAFPIELDKIIKSKKDIELIDVRNENELEQQGKIPRAKNIPLDSLRENLNLISTEKEIFVYCAKGMRGYLASRILKHNGFSNINNLAGGFTVWKDLGLEIEQ